MPNQRKEGKSFVGGFFDDELKAAIKAEAESEGESVSDLIKEFVIEGLRARGVKVSDEMVRAELGRDIGPLLKKGAKAPSKKAK